MVRNPKNSHYWMSLTILNKMLKMTFPPEVTKIEIAIFLFGKQYPRD